MAGGVELGAQPLKTICTVPPVGPERCILHCGFGCSCGAEGAFTGAAHRLLGGPLGTGGTTVVKFVPCQP